MPASKTRAGRPRAADFPESLPVLDAPLRFERLNPNPGAVSPGGRSVDLPLILAGPIVRRVEPNLASVWVALSESSSIKLTLWEGRATPADISLVTGPEPAVKTLRIGEMLHIAVVTLKITAASGNTLLPGRIYSYDLLIQTDSGRNENLKSQNLLRDGQINGHPHAALGYEPDVLPSFSLPPSELTDLHLIHGSCRRPSYAEPDGLAWVDDLILEARADQAAYALKRPHQLLMSGDQIYADDLSMGHLYMLSEFTKTLIGARRDTTNPGGLGDELIPIEELPVRGKSYPADLLHFPPGQRKNLILEEAKMTTVDGESHLLALGEFCAMYLFAWSNVCWPASFPAVSNFLPPFLYNVVMPQELRPIVIPAQPADPAEKPLEAGDADGIAKRKKSYEKTMGVLAAYQAVLPKVRRALANVPTYMMCDDHEVTDDWNLNPMWCDRVMTSPLGTTIIRNGLVSYALFQGWGNDPVKFEEPDYKSLLQSATRLVPASPGSGPSPKEAGDTVDRLLGFDQKPGLDSINPPIKWHYLVPGQRHYLLALDNRTRRSFSSRLSPPGNISISALKDQIPEEPLPVGIEVLIVIAPLVVAGPPTFDELIAPAAYRVFDVTSHGDLEKRAGTKGMTGTNPDAIEAWAFDPPTFEALLKRFEQYTRLGDAPHTHRPVVLLSGDVHYGGSNVLSYWRKEDAEPLRFAQFISSGFKNVMPWYIRFADRSLTFAQRLARARIGAERLGWEDRSPKFFLPPDAKLVPAIRAKLSRIPPVMIPAESVPEGTAVSRSDFPDWSWRVEVIRDKRPDEERPKPAQPDKLDVPDVAPTFDGYRRIGRRHAGQLEKRNNTRQIVFASNLGLITFQKRSETINSKREEIIDATQALYSVHPNAVDPTKPEPYAVHVVPLRAPLEPRPEERLKLQGTS